MRCILEITCEEPVTANWVSCNECILAMGWESCAHPEAAKIIARLAFPDIIPNLCPESYHIHNLHVRADDLRRLKFNVVEEAMRWVP